MVNNSNKGLISAHGQRTFRSAKNGAKGKKETATGVPSAEAQSLDEERVSQLPEEGGRENTLEKGGNRIKKETPD